MGSHGVQHFMDTSNFNDGHEHDDFALEKVFKIMILDNTKSQNINVNASLRYLVDKVF
jgi:phage-related protein